MTTALNSDHIQARVAFTHVTDHAASSAVIDTSSIDKAAIEHALTVSLVPQDYDIALSPPSGQARSLRVGALAAAIASLPRDQARGSSSELPREVMQSLIRHGANDGKDNATVFRAAVDEKLAELAAACRGDSHYTARVESLARDTSELAIEGATNSSTSSAGRGGVMPFDSDPMFAILMALTQLQILLGQAEREHRAQQQEQQIIRAFAGAERLVKEAKSQLIGAIGAASLSTGVSAVGVSRVAKGQKIQRDAIRAEAMPAGGLAKAGVDVDVRSASTPTLKPQAEGSVGGKQASTGKPDLMQDSERGVSATDNGLAQRTSGYSADLAKRLQTESRLASLDGTRITSGGSAIVSMAGSIGTISSASFQVNAASHGRDGAMLRAEAEVAGREQDKASAMVDAHNQQLDAVQSLLSNLKEQQANVADHIARNTA